MTDWYCNFEGETTGPRSTEDVIMGLRHGTIKLGTKVCVVGESSWRALSSVREFGETVREVSPPPPSLQGFPTSRSRYGGSPASAATPAPATAPAQMTPPTFAGAPHVPPRHVAQPNGTQKSRLAFVLLGVFLGPLGIHNFYAGYTGRGAAQLAISLLTGWMCAPVILVCAWNVMELILVTHDADGVPLS
jgi:TM2 domain-containing membrane protein YozV